VVARQPVYRIPDRERHQAGRRARRAAGDIVGTRGGFDPNELDDFGMFPLSWAVLENRLDLVQTLLDLGADVNSVDKFGYTPALYAATIDHGDTEILELLIEQGADLTVMSKEGHTAISNARKFNYPDVVRVLETAGDR
jgi:ankyrin repeat protein